MDRHLPFLCPTWAQSLVPHMVLQAQPGVKPWNPWVRPPNKIQQQLYWEYTNKLREGKLILNITILEG